MVEIISKTLIIKANIRVDLIVFDAFLIRPLP